VTSLIIPFQGRGERKKLNEEDLTNRTELIGFVCLLMERESHHVTAVESVQEHKESKWIGAKALSWKVCGNA
jgi:hypothetical protein